MFTWKNEKGVPWSQILRINARNEFEAARYETDPKIIASLLYVGRDCLNQTTDKLLKALSNMPEKLK